MEYAKQDVAWGIDIEDAMIEAKRLPWKITDPFIFAASVRKQ